VDWHNVQGIMPDTWIRHMAESHAMIKPFVPIKTRTKEVLVYVGGDGKRRLVNDGLATTIMEREQVSAISYGCSSYGYDLRVADDFKLFTPTRTQLVDPKNFSEDCFDTIKGKGYCIIPPNSFALAYSVERFKIPENVMVVVVGKSTYARCGIIINVTPGEPGWEGHWTLEISNTTPIPAKVYANEGLCQALFFQGTPCATPYANGKYQDQDAEVTLPR
jgi:dCTP deaminase